MNAGHDFHLTIAEIAGHEWASRLHAQVDGQMARYRAFTNQSQARRTAALAEHRADPRRPSSPATPAQAARLAEAHVLAARDAALPTRSPTGSSSPGCGTL